MNWILIAVVVFIAAVLFRLRGVTPVSAETVAELRKQHPKVIDVRTSEEFRSGHLPHTIHVPLANLHHVIDRVVPDKDRPILLYCASGARSAAGKKALERRGYTNVHNLGSLRRAETLLGQTR